ncbi:MAG: hypothetical protein HY342_02835 [Candidatus Lambdaproteobacteria bacterium]|nr:hypothetical protein [Candidatus Lambdaproteobacteria bacterium]
MATRQGCVRKAAGTTPAVFVLALFALALLGPGGPGPAAAAERCTICHLETLYFSPMHDPAAIGCVGCHLGDAQARDKAAAHAGLEAYPGRVATVGETCARATCHAELEPLLRNNIMHSLNGMIELTRQALSLPARDDVALPLSQRLAQHGPESYLRKLCVSCHLGNERGSHRQSTSDRGGGCNACHLRDLLSEDGAAPRAADLPPESSGPGPREGQGSTDAPELRRGAHPALTLAIDSRRCFGCHSRSGRVSLNYVGLAETDTVDVARPQDYGRLEDGRLVRHRPPDLHSEAGLDCTDCHTAAGVMGTGAALHRQQQQLDIACDDCHAPAPHEKSLGELTRREAVLPGLHGWGSPDLARGRVLAGAIRGSALLHVYRQEGDQGQGTRRMLRKKRTGDVLAVPLTRAGPHHDLRGHERLTCEACHAAWAPQCDGCHISYDPSGRQWDHLLRRETPGRWIERRWSVRSDPPALGVRADNRIGPFVPGMSFILERPDGRPPLRRVIYSRISPHTTRKQGRSCESCHGDERALGVIVGHVHAPQHPGWVLPQGWVGRDVAQPAPGLHKGDRSLDRAERRRIARVGTCLPCHPGTAAMYRDFGAALGRMGPGRAHIDRFKKFYPAAGVGSSSRGEQRPFAR